MSDYLPIEIRDERLRNKRMVISSRTTRKAEYAKRYAAVVKLLERGELEIIERLRRRELRIEVVQQKVDEDKIDELRRISAEPLTLDAVLKRTMAAVEATREPSTVASYVTLDRMLRAWLTDEYDITRLTQDEAEKWLFAPKPTNRDEPWGASRQITIVTLAGRVWDDAIRREREAAEVAGSKPRITRNPWKAIETKGVRKKRAAYLQPEEWRTLRDVVRGTPKALAFGFGVLAGLRRGEITNLRTDIDVDTTKKLIHIQPREGEYRWRPKTDRSIRTLDISPELTQLVEEHIDSGFAGERYLIRGEWNDKPLVGNSIRLWAIEGFTAAGLKYGIEGDGLTMHSLRHTFASWLVQSGTSPMVVADLIGDTVQMVIDVYGHLAPRNYREAMEMVGRVSAGLASEKASDLANGW